MAWFKKSTTVRIRNRATRLFFRYAELLAPGLAGRVFRDLWFAAPPRMAELPVPPGGVPFTVDSQGATIHGQVWGEGTVVYLMHGWGGRGAQFGAMVEPLVAAGHRVVMFDAPNHGDSTAGPAGPRRTHGVEFARALDEVFTRFGPAEAVIAHSLGTIAMYLGLNNGWLGAERLVFVAPMVEAESLIDQFQAALGFGPRTLEAFDRAVRDFVGFPVTDFDARLQATRSTPLPTLVIADRDDRQTPYDDAAGFAAGIGAEFMSTEGLGHRKILRDVEVIARVVDFVAGEEATARSA
jgi:pimeloyl-ACP methyl ester carboxylesterase